MSDFSFSATAQCDVCGQYLSDSEEDCDHDGETISKHVFRRVDKRGAEAITGVKSSGTYKWDRLEQKVGDDWIAYEYLGTKEHVNKMLEFSRYENTDQVPKISMSFDRIK